MGEMYARDETDFATCFLARLRKIFICLYPLEVRESERDGIHHFNVKFAGICFYNAYPGGVQLVFNRRLLTRHFNNVFDFSEANAPDWRLIITIINDIAERIQQPHSSHTTTL